MKRETADVDASRLDDGSRRVLAALAGHPVGARANLTMEKRTDGSWSLVATIPSPTGERQREVSIWLDENHVPSLMFGGWHTHADLWDSNPDEGLLRMLQYLERIIAGEILLAETPTVGDGMPFRVIDVRDREEVLDELTSPLVSARMKLLSWSGTEDAVLEDLSEGPGPRR